MVVSRKTVAKLMRTDGITGISPRKWHPPTTIQRADPFPVPDLIERQFDQGVRDAAWFSDITYLHTAGIQAGEGWAYLCVVRDGHTRRVLGRTVGDRLHTRTLSRTLCARRSLCAGFPSLSGWCETPRCCGVAH